MNNFWSKIEEKLLAFWQKENIFEKSLKNREKGKTFVFYDGPPFANGLPHYGHLLAMSVKDLFCRYKTMQGYYVPRRAGWDCHGLPVEYEIEKELKISGKKEIEEYGIEQFNRKAKESVFRYVDVWEKTMLRLGRWIDTKNAYTTLSNDYIESVWWVFGQIWEKHLVYKDFKIVAYCPRCQTPLSNFEVNQGYRDVEDPSIYIKFKVLNSKFKNSFFLVWTTTPWTLPANIALAIGENIKYAIYTNGEERFILAKDLFKSLPNQLRRKLKLEKEISVRQLRGLEYEPLFKLDLVKIKPEITEEVMENAFKIYPADFVSLDEGTGIVHIAPAFGEDDFNLSKKIPLPIVLTVNGEGKIIKGLNIPGEGKFIKQADEDIESALEKEKLLAFQETINHTYPFCWRCESPLIYMTYPTWFIKVTDIVDKLVSNNKKINWLPSHLKEGRFGRWLKAAKDWALSRNRYWGAPLPIWICEKCGEMRCVQSKKALKILARFDLHRPFIDQITLDCSCGGKMKRTPEVFDCWFESGCVPYAQWHYPFEHKEIIKNFYPADFIAEGLDQTRGWFYTLLVISTVLFDSPAYKNAVVNGLILDEKGRKLSKKLRNYPQPFEIFNQYGADALRQFLFSSTQIGEDYRFSAKEVAEEYQKVISIFYNCYLYLENYGKEINWQNQESNPTILDKWILSRLNQTIAQTTKFMDDYKLTDASRVYEKFINDLSLWYLRRSRKRQDLAFFKTLYQSLLEACKIIAPFMPFLSEEIYQRLQKNWPSSDLPKSIHLCDWPKVDQSLINLDLEKQMEEIRLFATMALAQRAQSNIKVRQPLALLTIISSNEYSGQLLDILAQEINIKKVVWQKGGRAEVKLETKITPQLLEEGMVREIIRNIQDLRKGAGFAPTDKIKLLYKTEDKNINRILSKYEREISNATNCLISSKIEKVSVSARPSLDGSFEKEVEIVGKKIWLGVNR